MIIEPMIIIAEMNDLIIRREHIVAVEINTLSPYRENQWQVVLYAVGGHTFSTKLYKTKEEATMMKEWIVTQWKRGHSNEL